jgi:hypothetical protein
MSNSLVAVWTKIEDFFKALGLIGGPEAMVTRFIFGTALTCIVVHLFRPSFAYDPKGYPRPWAVTSQASRGDTLPTYIPWWLCGLIGGTLLITFV